MKSRGTFLWLSLGVVVVLPLVIALCFEIWAGGEIPDLKHAPPPAKLAAPSLSESPAAPVEFPAPPTATPATFTPEPKSPKSVWNSALPGPLLKSPIANAAFVKAEAGTLPHEKAILSILQTPAPNSVKAAALFGLLNQMPDEALATTTEQALKQLPDRNYGSLAYPLITNPKTHAQVLGTMMADLMERPDAVALPTLLKIAETPDHPFASSAHDNLTLLVGRDLGVDWPAWQDVVFKRVGAAGGP